MVESNHDEERMARIERMIERLQRDAKAQKLATAKLFEAVHVHIALHPHAAHPSSKKRAT